MGTALLAAITSWLSTKGVGLLLGAVSKLLLDYFNERRADQALRELGRAQAEAEQGRATIAAQEAELQAQSDAPRTVDDAIKKLEGEGEV